MELNTRIRKFSDEIMLSEDFLYNVWCTHEVRENKGLKSCCVRSGKGRIEYNPDRLFLLSDPEFKAKLMTELIRIALRHPYERRIAGATGDIIKQGSDMVISPCYKNMKDYGRLVEPGNYGLEEGKYYEWYCSKLLNKKQQDKEGYQKAAQEAEGKGKDTGGAAKEGQNGMGDDEGSFGRSSGDEYTELWDEDDEMKENLKRVIEGTTNFGHIPGGMVGVIQKSLTAKIDYRKVLRSFATSILSSRSAITRLKPNRRFGFQFPGSRREFSTRLLIAVDISGSVSDEALSKFFKVTTDFFGYGVEEADVLQFDCEAKVDQIMSLDKAKAKKSEFKIVGRGGTDFQVVFDYLKKNNNYDGVIIFTDGYAPAPKLDFPTKAKFCWCLENEKEYEDGKEWMKQVAPGKSKACFIL